MKLLEKAYIQWLFEEGYEDDEDSWAHFLDQKDIENSSATRILKEVE